MEINEAFAAQACAVNKEMGWDTSAHQRERRRDRARPSDRRVGLPRAGVAAARDGAARREEGPGVAVHRRRHGRGAGRRAIAFQGSPDGSRTALPRCGNESRRPIRPERIHQGGSKDVSRHASGRTRDRRHGRTGRGHLPQARRARLHGRHHLFARQHQGRRMARGDEGAGLRVPCVPVRRRRLGVRGGLRQEGHRRSRARSTCW